MLSDAVTLAGLAAFFSTAEVPCFEVNYRALIIAIEIVDCLHKTRPRSLDEAQLFIAKQMLVRTIKTRQDGEETLYAITV